MAVVVPVDPSSIGVGDVITFEAPVAGRPVVTHRVVEVLENGSTPVIRTKGDANSAPDGWTARISGSVAWRRVAVIPFAGRVVNVLRTPIVHDITVYAIPLLLLVVCLASIWTHRPDEGTVAEVGA
jgi:signal peptidase